jgi:integrase
MTAMDTILFDKLAYVEGLKRAGTASGVSFPALRHTHASALIAAGVGHRHGRP